MSDLQTAIARAGGLHTSAGLARRWGVSKQRAHQIVESEDFPAPAVQDGHLRLWSGVQADEYRQTRFNRQESNR